MRSTYRIPEGIRLYPQYLKEASYYCVNPGKKTDFNFAPWPKDTYDGNGDWTGRKPGQPFFCVFNSLTTHESCLHKTHVHPEFLKEEFQIPPYHPDTPEIRSNWVEYYHDITKMDGEVGAVLDRLEKDGLADDTIVFYFSDHGGILPRSKRFLYDSGLHVPLIVRFGKNFRHLAPGAAGSRFEAPVSFLDLAPSLLSLAGTKIPDYMQGHAFLGPQAAPPQQYAFGFRNRMDERYDFSRTVRDKRYRFIRNYMPHLIYGLHLAYLWKMPATVSWEQQFKAGKCNDAQSAFWREKPPVEVYDEQTDPYEVNNLAGKPEMKEIQDRLRAALHHHLIATRDTGFLIESEMLRRAGDSTIREMALDDHRYPVEKIVAAAELAAERDVEAVPKLIELMKDPDPGIRYWGAVGCCVRKEKAAPAADALRGLLKDESPAVRVMAAEALCRQGKADQGIASLLDAIGNGDTLLALNSLENLGDIINPFADSILAKLPHDGSENVGNATNTLLARFGKPLIPTNKKKK
jgi:hypothetical protein